jgi:hypothetical protein
VIVVDGSAVVLGLLNDADARRLMAEEGTSGSVDRGVHLRVA